MASRIVFAADTAQFVTPVQKSANEVRALKTELQNLQKAARDSFRDQQVVAKAAGASTEELRKIETNYFREKLALQQAAKQIDQSVVAGSREQVSAEEAKRRAIEVTTNTLKAQRAEVERLLPLQEKAAHYTPSAQQRASAILRGGGLRAGESFAASIPGFQTLSNVVFPVVGAIALGSAIFRGVEALVQMDKAARRVAENIKAGFGELVDPIRLSTDELLKTNAQLEISIGKLEHKPTNGLALAMAEARIEADKLATSAAKAYGDVKKLLEANQNGLYAQIFLGKGDTGLVSDQVAKGMASLRDLNGEYNRAVHSNASQSDLDAIKKKIEPTEKSLLDFANSQIATRTGSELTAEVDGRTGRVTNQHSAKYSDLHGSQDENLNILNGIRDYVYTTQDFRSASASVQSNTIKKDSLESQKQLGAESLAAQKKAEEEQRKMFDDQLADYEASGARTKAQIVAFWVDRENLTKIGSANFMATEKKVNEALRALNEENRKIFDESLKMQREFNAIGVAGLNGGALLTSGNEVAKGQAAASRSGLLLRQQQEDAARSIALSTIQWELQAGTISKADAAIQTQTIHTMQYEAAVQRLAEEYAAIAEGPNKSAQQNQLNTQLGELNGRRAVEIMQDSASVAGQSWKDALIRANAEFVQDSQNTAKQVTDLYSGTLNGLNGDLATYFTQVGRRGVHHAGRDLGNAVGGTVRSLGGSLAENGIRRAESSVLGAFGLGGKPDGTRSNPLFVQMMSQLGYTPGAGGVFDGDLAAKLGFGGNDSGGSTSSSKSSAGGIFGSLVGFAAKLFGGGLAVGGTAAAGKTFLVGENGPELFSPASTGYVTPANRTSSLMGGGVSMGGITIDARGATDPAAVHAAAHRAVMEAAPHIVAASIAAGQDRRNRTPTSKIG